MSSKEIPWIYFHAYKFRNNPFVIVQCIDPLGYDSDLQRICIIKLVGKNVLSFIIEHENFCIMVQELSFLFFFYITHKDIGMEHFKDILKPLSLSYCSVNTM